MAKTDITAINGRTISINGTPIAGSGPQTGPYTTFDQLDADVALYLNGALVQGSAVPGQIVTNYGDINVLSGMSQGDAVRYGAASSPATEAATGPASGFGSVIIGGNQPPPPTLATLTLSTALTSGSAVSGAILGATNGSTITSNVAGLSVNSAARTFAFDGSAVAGSTANGLVETLAGAVGSPKSSAVTVAAAASVLPQAGSIAARWSADDIPAQADNTAIATWTDGVAGIVSTASSAGTFTTPKYRTNRINGKPTVEFDGKARFLMGRPTVMTGALGATRWTMMFVFRNLAVGPNVEASAVFGSGDVSGATWIVASGTRVGRYAGAAPNGGSIPYSSAGFSTLIVTRDTASSPQRGRTYVNGGCAIAAAPSSGGAGTGDYVLGASQDNASFGCKLELMEAIVWNGVALSQVDALKAHKWACDKFAQPYPWAGLSSFDLFAGDSITAGTGSTAAEYTYPYRAMTTLGRSFGQWGNIGIPSATIDVMNATCAVDCDGITAVTGLPVRLIAWEWTNVRGSTITAAQSSMTTFLSNRKSAQPNIKIILADSVAVGGNSNGDQNSDGTTSGQGNGRTAWNAYIAGLTTNVDVKLVFSTDPDIGVIGANPYSTTYPYNNKWNDPLHPLGNATTPNGYSIMASIAVPVLNANP